MPGTQLTVCQGRPKGNTFLMWEMLFKRHMQGLWSSETHQALKNGGEGFLAGQHPPTLRGEEGGSCQVQGAAAPGVGVSSRYGRCSEQLDEGAVCREALWEGLKQEVIHQESGSRKTGMTKPWRLNSRGKKLVRGKAASGILCFIP